MVLTELLSIIDPEQYITIQHKGDILFRGRSKWCNRDINENIKVINVLTTVIFDNIPGILICIDSTL